MIGDNRMRIDDEYERIPTADFVEAIAVDNGFDLREHLDISVTTEKLVHINNAITKNGSIAIGSEAVEGRCRSGVAKSSVAVPNGLSAVLDPLGIFRRCHSG